MEGGGECDLYSVGFCQNGGGQGGSSGAGGGGHVPCTAGTGGLYDPVCMGLCGKPAGRKDASVRRQGTDHEDGGRVENRNREPDQRAGKPGG